MSLITTTGRIGHALSSGFFGRLRVNREIASALSRMDAAALADIGLSRQDVADLGALPFTADSGAFLSRRVAERRQSR